MKKKFTIFMMSLLLFLTACQNDTNTLEIKEDPVTRTEALLDTVVQISVYHDGEEVDLALDKAFAYLAEMNQKLTIYEKGSEIDQVNQKAGQEAVQVSPETFQVVKEGHRFSEISQGVFDITIGPLSTLWKDAADGGHAPPDEDIQEARRLVDLDKLVLDEERNSLYLEEAGMALDLGGIAKGYLGDGVKDILASHGITTATINLGGNVVVMGSSPKSNEGWRVGVQNPFEVSGDVVASVRVKDAAVVTSGIYERYIEEDGNFYHHILSPENGYPVDNDLAAVTIVAEDSLTGDGLSTTIFALGLEEGLAFVEETEGVEAVFITKDNQVHISSGIENFELMHADYTLVE